MKFDAADYPGAEVAAVERSRDSRRRIATVIAYEGEGHSAREVLELLTNETGGLGDDEPTREHFQRIAYTARLNARFFRDAGKFDEALRTLAAVPRASSHRADALFERANIAVLAGRNEEAGRCFEEIRSQHPGSFAATCLEAQVADKLKRPDEAVRLWRAATVLRPDSESAFAHLGDALANLGRPDEARQACLKSLELDPQNALARQVLDRLGKR